MPSGEGRMTRGRMRELGGMEQKGTEKFQTTTIAMQRDAVTGGEKLRDNSTIVLAIEEERAQDEEPTIAHHVPSKTDAGAMQLNVSNVLQTEGQNDLEARTASPVGEEVVVGQLLPCYEHLVHEQINNTELESHLETTLRAFYDGFFQGRRENHYISLYSPALPSKSYGNSDREGAGSQRFLLQPLTKEPILFVEALGTHSPTTPPETPSQQQDKPCIRTEIGTELSLETKISTSIKMSDQDAPPAKRPRVSSEDSDLPLYPQTPTRTPPFSLDEIASSPLSSPPPSSPLSPPSSVDRTLLVKLKLPVAQPIKEGEPQPLTFSVPARPIAKAKPASRRKAAPKTTQPKKPRAKKVQVKKEEVVNAQEGKPEPFGSPEIWADKRQQFCEALRWHRSLQKGAYTHDNIAYGLLIDKEVTIRDRFDDQIIITTVGGGRTQDESGKSKRTKNQDKSTTAVAFQRSQAKKIPIGVVAGQGNSISPSKLPYYYNVLGWFQVTDVWCEFVEGFSTWKIRLEKIDLCKTSWWAAKTAEIRPAPNFTEPKARSLSCGSCGVETKEMFNCGWTCLNRPCQNFFQFPDDVDQDKLDYNPAFLNERTSWTGEWPGSLSEPLPTKEYLGSKFASGTESEFFKGIVCPKCGICVRRRDWDQWTCENEKCDFVHELKPKAVPIADILAIDPTEKHSDPLKYLFSDVVGYSGPKTKGLYTAYRFTLPGDHDALPGYVTFYKSCKLINSQPDGPNDQFRDMQIYNFGMMRKPSRGGESAYGVLTRHWAANWGAPYKFSVAHDSKEFRHAPEVLIKALKRMTWAGKEALGDLPADAQVPFVPFNELLSVGYFETGKMDYHDDGEKTLGPTVSSISLGSSATMVFRPKVGSHIMGPGKPNPKGEKKDVLSFVLEHGDIMVMHGSGIHKHYEHKVTPHGKIRFALTSRHILIDKIPANEVDYANRATQLPAGSDRYNYDGDVNARTIYESPTAKEEIRGLFNRALTRVQLGETTMAEVDELYERLKQEMEQKTNAPAS